MGGKEWQVLLGVTGSGKTFTVANVIQQLNRPVLVIAHNKTLAAQLCSEFREFFPENPVEFFISYYDYYQPEAYVPSRDIYIEKESDINEEIERLRHKATRSVISSNQVIVVASVSCIYGLGLPEDYAKGVISVKVGEDYPRRKFLLALEGVQYERNDIELKQGRYRVSGDIFDIFPSWEERVLRLEFFGDELERISFIHPITKKTLVEMTEFELFPATHYVVNRNLDDAIDRIAKELKVQLADFKEKGMLVEAQRLEQRTHFDIDMMQEMGYCKGIENYSRHISGRPAGDPGGVLLDFFSGDFITIIDESHATLPQVRGMYKGDRARKINLVDYGFRLPSAIDNRPLNFEEFQSKIGQVLCVSATPGDFELDKVKIVDEVQEFVDADKHWAQFELAMQVIRPTGLLDPEVILRKSKHQIDDLLIRIDERVQNKERVFVTTLTKKMAEDVAAFLENKGIKVRYLHSDIKALDRVDLLHDLRLGKYDVLVGVNLLREGLDIPEVSLVAIFDADKEGFLRNERSLIQTMGRAARNVRGQVVLYADKLTRSMKFAIDETNRRRQIQMAHNEKHGIKPQTIIKKITSIRAEDRKEVEYIEEKVKNTSPKELPKLIRRMEKDMQKAAKNLEFELAAVLRDEIEKLKGNV